MGNVERSRSIRLGTRGSALARWQTRYVAGILQAALPDLCIETRIMTTRGDRILDRPLPQVGGKGLFTAELEAALRAREIDLAVHSLKDLPTDNPEGLIIGAIPKRANPADVLICRGTHTLQTLPAGAVVGTSSLRRAAQLLHRRSDLRIADIRGNVDTRIGKALDPDGPYDAIVLAYAGLERLERLAVISQVFTFDEMLPAPGQGALGVQCRDDKTSCDLLAPVHHLETALAVTAERAFLSGLGGGCSVPVAAYASTNAGGRTHLQGRVISLDGSKQIEVSIEFTENNIEAAQHAGHELAKQALTKGAAVILEQVRCAVD